MTNEIHTVIEKLDEKIYNMTRKRAELITKLEQEAYDYCNMLFLDQIKWRDIVEEKAFTKDDLEYIKENNKIICI